MNQPIFNVVGDTFTDYYSQVRGYVREVITRRNLELYLTKDKLTILDIGGGDGRDAVWLARKGHYVHLIDPSKAMIKKAKQRIDKTSFKSQINLECGDPMHMLKTAKARYDVVLSHGVLMYLDTRELVQHINLLNQVVKVDGIVSILTKGKDGSIARLIGQNKTNESLELENTGYMVNNLAQKVRAVNKSSMKQLTSHTSLTLKNWYGVRVASDSDYRSISDVAAQELSAQLAVEERLSKTIEAKGMGQMLHFIYQKTP